ncbi:4-hydroxythreonine-4-phosphate dehydrogenase PdxA [Alphaproteobacteria bacterium]|nr:4-hydroxythreonine-4-phosphate dehydrogenase PdxA [Alphaproteobacteria bacterium]
MIASKKIILISAGDPASIAPEITIKAIQSSKMNKNIKPIVVTDSEIIKDYNKNFKKNVIFNEIKDIQNFTDFKHNYLNIIPIKLSEKVVVGKPSIKNANFVKASIFKSVKIQMNSSASAIVTNPINKNIMYKSGFKFNGHTEYLASLSIKKKFPVMMMVSNELKTIPLTIHEPLKKVPSLISKNLILLTIKIIAEDFNSYFGIKKPKIVITGLNPHAGENGEIGEEEEKIIIPAIKEGNKNKDILLSGPLSSDVAFTSCIRKNYDVAICMYHDQALIPIKTLAFDNGINVTLGLDFIRTSPDHGTGFDIAGKNKANPDSLISAINLAYQMSINKNK